MRAAHGLVIGKFYPPHAGHHLLVRTAAACSDRLTVVVAASSVESIPLADRVAWMREVHPEPHVRVVGAVDDHPIDYDDDAIWRAHVDVFREAAGDPVDAVFSSEDYGEELARRMGARHVPVDPVRGLFPVSGTAVRRDPASAWDFLAPPVRAGLALRVVLVGAESTGKSTLAAELADALRRRGGAHGLTRWVPEHGRDYTIELLARSRARAVLEGRPPPALEDLAWETADFVAIARRQDALERQLAREGGPVLVCDTDAFATGIWHERYTGAPSADVDAVGVRKDGLYLLTDPDDVPFVQDGLRDGEALRRWMTDRFADRLTATGRCWSWLRGDRAERLERALSLIEAALSEKRFTDPLG